MARNLSDPNTAMESDSVTKSDDETLLEIVKKIYGSDVHPLFYMIEPRGSAGVVDKDADLTPPKSILP